MTYPIVLAHGMCRFDALLNDALNLDNNDDPELDNLHYFKGIRTMLKKKGYVVYHSNVAWAAGVEKRADDLKENLLKILKGTLDKTDHLNEMGWWDPDQLLAAESPDELLARIHSFYAGIAG